MFAVLAVLIMATVAFVPALEQVESESSEDYWTYTVKSDGTVTSSGTTVQGFKAPSTSTGKYDKNTEGYDTGAWGFDSDGYGPFGSFYAAFDACHGNKILCHLDPNNLKSSIDGTITIDQYSKYDGHTINIMWVLPTIYWKVDSSGSLVLTNDPKAGGVAYAHTIDGEVHEYLGIGVYEASSTTIGGKIVLTSTTGTKPLNDANKPVNESMDRAHFRTYANNNTVATEDGTTVTGHAMLWNLYAWQLYRFCVLTVGGGWNSQAIFGNGDVYGGHFGSNVALTGDLDQSGPYAGNVGGSDGCATGYSGDTSKGEGKSAHHSDSVKAFIEDAWGSLNDFVDGVLIYKNSNQVQMYATQAAVPKDEYTESDYPNKIGVLPSSGRYGSPDATFSTNAAFWGLPSSSATGSASSGLCDYIWSAGDTSSSSSHGLSVGGYSNNTTSYAPWDGLSCMVTNIAVTISYASIGGRLAFVFDGDLAVKYDHSQLKSLLDEFGYSEDLMKELPTVRTITEGGEYDQLQDIVGVNGFRHVGWIIDGKEYPATHNFVKMTAHTAESVWVGLPAVTYDHSELIAFSQDQSSEAGLSHGIEIKGHDSYEQLPSRDGYVHIGWRIEFDGKMYQVGPTGGFVTRNSHTAVSLWIAVPVVIFDHSQLTDIVGTDAEGVSDLQTYMIIEGNGNYLQLPNTAGYKHIGWEIDGKTVGPTAALESQETHNAKSLWEKISSSGSFRPIPIIPDDTDPEDPGAVVPVVIHENSEPWLWKNGKTVLLIAVVVAIIAELAVLCISRKR